MFIFIAIVIREKDEYTIHNNATSRQAHLGGNSEGLTGCFI